MWVWAQQAPRQEETGDRDREQRQQVVDQQGPRQRLAMPWEEARQNQTPRARLHQNQTQPQDTGNQTRASYAAAARAGMTAPQAASTRSVGPPGRHRLREPVVGAWGEPNRRTADRGARWIVAPDSRTDRRRQAQARKERFGKERERV